MIENVEVIAKAFESCNNSLPSKFLNCFGESHDSITNLLEEILLVEKKEVSMFSKNLFSKDFKIEEQQSELCLKILNECFKEIKLIRPVIFITDDSKIVSFFPVETQSPKSKKSIMYFLDLSTGIREICKNTKSDIFYNFLLYGDTKHYIKSFIPSLIKLSIVRTPVKYCINNLKWWTIYYVIMLIHYGNDEFLQLDTWGHEEKVENIKSVILTYLDKSQDTIKVYNQYNSIDLKKFFYLNDLIKKGYLKIEKDLLKEIEVINELKFDVVKNKSKEDEKKLLEKKSKLSIEINEIHKNLSECEGFISFKKSEIDTTESKFRRFITGEEKKLTDSGIEKKFEKLRNAILENNSKNLEQLILEEIKKLENQIFQNDLNIKSKSEYLIKLNNSIVENLDKINENELKIQTHKIRNLKLSENLNDINSKINDKKTTFNKINEFDIRKDYFLLIEQIKGSKTNYEMKNFESLREEIEKTDFKLNNSLLNLKESRKNLEQSENQTIQSEYQLNKLNGELAILKNEESEELDKIKTLKKEYADYDTWYYRTYYWSYTTELLAKIKRADSSLNQIKNRLKNKNDEIENLKTTITNLVANVKQNKKGAVELELICQQINQEKINQLNNLKIQKQNILNFISDKLISELDAEALNIKTEIKTNDIEISTSTDLIKNLKKDNQTIEEKLALSDVSLKSLFKTKCEYQDKIKKLTLKLKEEDKDIRKNALETLEYVFQGMILKAM
ncbi:unnamed protein product [Brachionus calyciflorus]|uniref:Uncharacterized protein n=1 Tax=Brachionus calyciflorus TaxID=104777 RepID=A0A814C898_9BILA|nr:unnamed protein product [Brachionus calyciflorus]